MGDLSQPRIVIIGGGSFAWGPPFIRDIAVTRALAGATVVLHDIDAAALDLVYRFGRHLVQSGNLPVTLQKTMQLEEALQGAHFVILTITTGGLEAMRYDLEIPARFGIAQSVGDTVGPGGLFRALRNIPVAVEIARKMEAICPGAWLLNYTNPLSCLTRAVARESGIQVIGLCHEFFFVRQKLARLLGVPAGEISGRLAGINHLPWLLDIRVSGEDGMPRLRRLATDILATRGETVLQGESSPWSTLDRGMVKARLLQIYGGLPAAGDRHVAEFFPGFLAEATGHGRQYGIILTNVAERYAWRAAEERFIQAGLAGEIDLATYIATPSGEAASQIIAAVVAGERYQGVMNLPNQGQIANLPQAVGASGPVVEGFGVIDREGARLNPAGDLPPAIRSVVQRHLENQEMIVEAALQRDRQLAFQVMLQDPLVTLEPRAAGQMFDQMWQAHAHYLAGYR